MTSTARAFLARNGKGGGMTNLKERTKMTQPTMVEAVANVVQRRCERQGVPGEWRVFRHNEDVWLEMNSGYKIRVGRNGQAN